MKKFSFSRTHKLFDRRSLRIFNAINMGVHRTISTSGPLWVTRVLPGVVSAATVVFLRMSFSSFSSPICKRMIDRAGLISFLLILLVLAALHVLEPIGQLSRHLFGIETPIGYDPFESLKKHLQPLGLGALVVALFFLGNYQSSVHATYWGI